MTAAEVGPIDPHPQCVVVASPGNAPREDAAARLAEAYLAQHAGVPVARTSLLLAAVPQAAAMRLTGVTPGGARAAVAGDFAALAGRLKDDPLVATLAAGGIERAADELAGAGTSAVLACGDLAAGIAAEASAGRWLTAALLPHFDPVTCWLHPGVALWFVPCAEARDELVVRGVPFDRVAVTGVPSAAPAPPARERFAVGVLPERVTPGGRALVRGLASLGVPVLIATGDDARLASDLGAAATGAVRAVPGPDAQAEVLASASVAVCSADSPHVFAALAAGVPLVVHEAPDERALRDGDFLVDVGAALPARDEDDAVARVRFLATHPDRLSEMAEDSRALGRPDATKALCERFLAGIR
ncbi:MAG: hypothetical protein FDZ70_03890 [Actinobacteria bacterium]|nr:MAG: hypothetical protein FDZ70_03890 [Actinomycetota bacterium]